MPDIDTKPADLVRSKRYRQAALLLEKWAGEDSQYDERAGSALEQELKDAAMRCEEQDETSA